METEQENVGLVRHQLDEGRFYTFQGDPRMFPSVTSILNIPGDYMRKSFYVKNTEKKIEARKAETADIGNKIEEMVMNELEGKPCEDPAMEPYVTAFRKIRETNEIKVIWKKKMVASRKYGYAGELDLFVNLNGEHTIIDVKSGWASVTHAWQEAAYAQAIEEECGMKGIKCATLSIFRERPEQSKIMLVEHRDWCLRQFLSCLEVWKGIHFNKFLFKWHNEEKYPWLFTPAVEVTP